MAVNILGCRTCIRTPIMQCRLQSILAILLNFHLGLAPSAARELRYRDVKIVDRLDQGKLRAICMIQQRGYRLRRHHIAIYYPQAGLALPADTIIFT